MKIDSTLTVKDSVRLKSKLTVDQKAVFKQNLVVKGQMLRAHHNARINNNLVVDHNIVAHNNIKAENKLTVNGLTKLNGIVKMLGINQITQQQVDNGNFNILVTKANGEVVIIPPNVIGEIFGFAEPPYSDDGGTPLCGTSSINVAAGWTFYTTLNKTVSCSKVGINKMPQYDLDINGTTRTPLLNCGNQINYNDTYNSFFNLFSSYNQLSKMKIGEKTNGTLNVFFEIKRNGTVVIKPRNSNNPLIIKNQNGQKIFQVQENGLVRAREIKVDLDYANWPDYVFNENYQLLDLEQVAKYILKHKHLPGVPSAKVISTEGLSVGKMQTLLMQKIEELTLYTIEQNTQIKHLEKNVTTLEKENQQLKAELKQMNDRLVKIEALLNH